VRASDLARGAHFGCRAHLWMPWAESARLNAKAPGTHKSITPGKKRSLHHRPKSFEGVRQSFTLGTVRLLAPPTRLSAFAGLLVGGEQYTVDGQDTSSALRLPQGSRLERMMSKRKSRRVYKSNSAPPRLPTNICQPARCKALTPARTTREMGALPVDVVIREADCVRLALSSSGATP
jgi:hypothetical protein